MGTDFSEKQPTILLVDDTAENLMLLTEILKDEYRIRVATNGEKALTIARSDNPPDLILLDIMMPGIDGHEVCRQLKGNPKTARIPIIFVTALSESEDESIGFDLGAVDYLSKPVRPKIVKARVKTHVSLYHQERLVDASRQKFQRLVDDVGDKFVVFSYTPVERKVTYMSDGAQTVFGIEKSELINQDWLTSIAWIPEDFHQLLWVSQELRDQHLQSYEAQHSFLHSDGTQHIVSMAKHLSLDKRGNLIAIEGIIQDITQQKFFETQLRQQAEQERLLATITQRLRSSLNLSEILDTTVQETHRTLQSDRVLVYKVFANGTGAAIAESVSPGWPKLLDRIFPEEVFPQENYDRYLKGRIFALQDSQVQNNLILPCLLDFLAELQVRAKLVIPIIQDQALWGLIIAHQCSQPREWMDWEINLMHRIADQLAIAIQQAKLFEQLEERNQQLAISNEELLRATRLKDEFLANMSHELRTPLNAILGMTEGMQEGIFGEINPKQLNALQTIERSGTHLLDLINDILDLAKVESGKMEIDCTPVAMDTLCQSSLIFIKQQAYKKQIQLQSQIPVDLPVLMVDERRIRQVLINLLNNAVKFTPEKGTIILSILYPSPYQPPSEETEQRMYLRITIEDTGIGINPENAQKLFRPFMQIDSALNRQNTGTGLGLALVKRIVELHGGTVSLESESGKGSRFMIDLPCPEHSQVIASTPQSTPLTIQTFNNPVSPAVILLADDNEANVSTTSSYLTARGYTVILASNGAEAIDRAQAENPDLILMDVQMPIVDGLTAIQHIRKLPDFTTTPIIALTALAMDGDQDRCLAAGANEYLSKPVQLKQLLVLIQKLLNG